MNILKRAILYITRKRGKALIIFLILLILSTFAITGISILKATQRTALSLRQSVGGSIKLELDDSKKKNWTYKQGVGGVMVDYIGKPITDDEIQKIMSIKGVKDYNAVGDGSVFAIDFNFISGISFGMGSDYSRLPSVTNSEYFNYFKRGAFRLKEGRHINSSDSHVVLISSALAKKNKLKIEDKITVKCCYDKGNWSDVQLTIIGIYEITQEPDPYCTTSTDKRNRLIIDHKAMQDIMNMDTIEYANGVSFYVDDPKDIENIEKEIKKLDLNWDCFKLSIDNTEYRAVEKSLNAMQNIIIVLIVGIIIASIVILSLILNMWIKQRTREIGILLSVGTGKLKIITQYIIEILLIAIIAFGLSYFSSNMIAEKTSNIIFNKFAEKPTTIEPKTPDDGTEYLDIEGKYISYDIDVKEKVDSISVEITSEILLIAYLIGTVIIIVSVTIASVKIICMKPKDILSKMV